MDAAKMIDEAPAGQVVPMSLRERVSDAAARDNAPKRDWSAALNLVNECFEAVRLADERAASAEAHIAELTQRLDEQTRTAESRLATMVKRAEHAEARARHAEEWLVKFHDAITDGFQKTFVGERG